MDPLEPKLRSLTKLIARILLQRQMPRQGGLSVFLVSEREVIW